ncbi:hypothetical protein EDB81DRAFT_942678 [Dactylonectria macrodidyma]|uniref:Uncharacterized protein n=1 Tax=Dactylonectria macrodidyma TaxID=307937 RepID=A0A9P9FMF5_9HYPO|nr:hypothetical protein EDB81DRAFT_942678 [Dactylonectria macrodidyma]
MEDAARNLDKEEEGVVDPNRGTLPLHKVCDLPVNITRRLAWAREALRNGHDINQLDPDQSEHHLGRPLHVALDKTGCSLGVNRLTANKYDRLELVDLYLQKGADPRLRDRFGVSAIDKARSKINEVDIHQMNPEFWETALVKMFDAIGKLEEEEDGERNPNNPLLPFHKLAGMDISVRRCLAWALEALENGHDINELDPEPSAAKNLGRPLHAALHDRRPAISFENCNEKLYESLDLIQFFLKHGADPRLKDLEGKTPMEKAITKLFS